jgi:hypothetical protein
MLGNKNASEQVCDDTLKRFGQTKDEDQGHWVARTCLLCPRKASSRVIELADQSVRGTPKAYFYRVWAAGASFRAGKSEQALKRLAEAVEAHGDGGTSYDLFFLSMTQQSLGKSDDARSNLEKGFRWLERMEKGEIEDAILGNKLSYNHVAELRLLRREAENRIKAKGGP